MRILILIQKRKKGIRLSAGLHVNPIQVPLPVMVGAHHIAMLAAYRCYENWARSDPTIPDMLIGNLDVKLTQKFLNVAQGQSDK